MYNEGFNCHLMDFISLKYLFARNVVVMFSSFKINADLSETCLVPSVYKMCTTIDLCYLGRRDCANIFMGFIWCWTLNFCGSLGIFWLAQRPRASQVCAPWDWIKFTCKELRLKCCSDGMSKLTDDPQKHTMLRWNWHENGEVFIDRNRFLTSEEVLKILRVLFTLKYYYFYVYTHVTLMY
jgi:hypothetical protein